MEQLIATIQFIGLALFSAQVPNTPGLQVLLPRVEAHAHAVTEGTPQTDLLVDIEPTTTEVPPHRAFIIYKEADFLSEIGWTSENLPEQNIRTGTATPLPRYKYVALDGELVKFYTDGANTAVSRVPTPLPKPLCGDRFALNALAARISIPTGALSTCAAKFFGTEGRRRFDTQLKLKNSGELIITGQLDGVLKALTLRGNAKVYIANIPEAMVLEGVLAEGSGEHYRAYYDLIATKCDQKGLTPFAATLKISTCSIEPLKITGDPEPRMVQTIVDSNCSNSTFP